MQILLLFILLIVNFAISCWDAYVAGKIWREVSGFMKLVAWSALIMSACGFLMVSAVVLGFLAVSVHWIHPRGMDAVISLTYLMIIVPVLGAGTIITIHSWIEAYRRRDFGSIAVAGWNTFADASNIYDASNDGVSSALDSVLNFFDSDDDKDVIAKTAVLLVLLVAMLIAGGLALVFFQTGRRHAVSPTIAVAARG